MVTTQQKRALGTIATHPQIEAALTTLKDSGFPMEKLSVIAKGQDQKDGSDGTVATSDQLNDTKVDTTSNVVGDTARIGATGFTILGLTSLIFPGYGMVLAAGSFLAALTATVASTGASAVASGNLVKAITDMSIPEAQAKVYSDRLQQGYYLIMVEGTEEEIQQVESVLKEHDIRDWGIY